MTTNSFVGTRIYYRSMVTTSCNGQPGDTKDLDSDATVISL
jgi:hypothetical protein